MRRFNLTKAKLFLGFGLMVGLLFLQDHKASASGTVEPVTVDTVDYKEEEIILNNNGNTKFYFATETDAARGSWEVIPADVNADDTTRLDFSWVPSSLDNIIKVKGGDDSAGTQVRIELPERTSKLDISINYANINSLAKADSIAPLLNIMTTAGTSADPITFDDLEWKKGENGYWKEISLLTVAQLEKYQIKGTELYFRIKAVNDITRVVGSEIIYPDGNIGRRASSEVKVKINKKATAMVVGIDGSKFTADIKYGKEYRVTIGANRTDWIKVTDRATKRLDLIDVIKELEDIPDGITKPFPAMFLEIRDYATTKAAASKITEINLNAQRVLDEARVKKGPAPKGAPATDQSIYISYTGDKNIVITIPSASTGNAYEYCVVKPGEIKPGDTLDLSSTLWSTITKGTDVKVLKNKAVDNGVLYIRQKEIKSRAATRTTSAVSYELASTVITHDIQYPNIPVVEKGSHTFVKNTYLATNQIEFDIKLNTAGRDVYEWDIKSIKLGTKVIDFTPTYIPEKPDETTYDKNNAYTITVTLDQTSLQNTPNCYNRGLTITFMNGTVDKTSVLLTVKYPTEAMDLTVTPGKGATGRTKVGVTTDLGVGNAYGYIITPESMDGKIFVEDIKDNYTNFKPFTPGDEILVVDKEHLTIIEYNTATGHFIKYRSIPITPEIIG